MINERMLITDIHKLSTPRQQQTKGGLSFTVESQSKIHNSDASKNNVYQHPAYSSNLQQMQQPAPLNNLNLETYQSNSLHNQSQSAVTTTAQPANQLYGSGLAIGTERQLFYKVHDSTLIQEDNNQTDNEIDYLDEEEDYDPDQPTSAMLVNNDPWQMRQQQQEQFSMDHENDNASGMTVEQRLGDIDEDQDDEDDGVPMIEEVIDEDEIYCQPSSSNLRANVSIDKRMMNNMRNEEAEAAGAVFSDDHNIDRHDSPHLMQTHQRQQNPFDDSQVKVLSAQKPDLYDRNSVKLASQSEKKAEKRAQQVKSLVQPSNTFQIMNKDNLSLGGYPGGQQNFAKHKLTHHPKSPSVGAWTGSLAQASQSSSRYLGGGGSTISSQKKSNKAHIGNGKNGPQFKKRIGPHYNAKTQLQQTHQQQTNNVAYQRAISGAKIGSLSHTKSPSLKNATTMQKDNATAYKKKRLPPFVVSDQKVELVSSTNIVKNQVKVTIGSFEARQGSHSMTYIPPRRIQDQKSLQLIHVPLSRAELNNQSAYHPVDQSQNALSLESSTPGNHQNNSGVNSRQHLTTEYQMTGPATKLQRKGQEESTSVVNISKAEFFQPSISENPVVFSRSLSNQQIGVSANATTPAQQALSKAHAQVINQQRQSNSRTRLQQRQKDPPKKVLVGSSAMYAATASITGQSAGSSAQKPTVANNKRTNTGLYVSTVTRLSSQQAKVQRKNQNNLKMSTMQLRDQDFKKITSQIQSCYTMTNAKRKKFQFHSKSAALQLTIKSGQQQQTANKTRVETPVTAKQRSTPTAKVSLLVKIPLKLTGPLQSSNMMVSEDSSQCQPEELTIQEKFSVTHQVSGTRKFAHSLTDNYTGDFVISREDRTDFALARQQAGDRLSPIITSSDGETSCQIIPSENERVEIKLQEKADTKKQNVMQYPSRKTPISVKRPNTSQKTMVDKRGGSSSLLHQSKNEPHRLVKVSSKPFTGNTLVSKNDGSQKTSSLQQYHPRQPLPSAILPTNPNLQKKACSFGGGFREPVSEDQEIISGPHHRKTGSFLSQKSQPITHKGAQVSLHSITKTNKASPQHSKSPKKSLRQLQVHQNSKWSGSLIAGFINQTPILHIEEGSHEGSFAAKKADKSPFMGASQKFGHGNKAARSTQALNRPIQLAPATQHNNNINDKNGSGKTSLQNKSNSLSKRGIKKPGGQKIQAAGSSAEFSSTALKRTILGSTGHVYKIPGSLSKDPTDMAQYFRSHQQRTAMAQQSQKQLLVKKEPSQDARNLELHTQQTSDQRRTSNIQLLRQKHHKQITTASKGKDSGSVQKWQVAGQGKSYSVLVPSSKSIVPSKALVLEGNQAQNQHQYNNKPQVPQENTQNETNKRSLLAEFAEKDRRPGGGSLVIRHDSSPVNQRPEHGFKSSKQKEQLDSQLVSSERPPSTVRSGNEEQKSELLVSGDPTLQELPNSTKKNSFVSAKFNVSQNTNGLNVIQERLESQDSVLSDHSLSPRSRQIVKLQKKVKLSFLKTNVPPETQTENYKIGKVMGKGAFGKVNLAIHRLAGKFVALKSINKQFMSQEQSKRKVMQEFNILRRTRHCNIVRLYESFETLQHIVFVMEVCGGGDLLTYVRRRRKLKEDTARFLFKQIVTALAYCHTKNVLHRDIKLDNILLTSQGDVKICDFGVSKLVTVGETMSEQCGTPAYIAPEVFKNLGYQGFASDIWSAGVVLYAMLYGAVPFKASNMAELHKQVLEREPTYKEEEVSNEALSLLKGILDKDPLKRLTSDAILNHKWMRGPQSKHQRPVSVFTDQEKEGIISEFEYYNKRERDVIVDGVHQVMPTDPFAEQMLSSTQNSGIKNVSTRSIILAPFNTTQSQLASTEEDQLMQELLVPRQALKFSARVKEIDRQYELNNNADLDNGVYHQDDEDEEENKNETGLHPGSSPPKPTEERCESRQRNRTLDELQIAKSLNQEQLHSQLDELEEAVSINSDELDEGGCNLRESSPILPKNSKKEQQQNIQNNNKNTDKQGQQELSEWRQLEKQIIKGADVSEYGSPSKHNLLNQDVPKGIQGDKAIHDSSDQAHDLLNESYEQVQIELYVEDEDNRQDQSPGLRVANNIIQMDPASEADPVSLKKSQNIAMGPNPQQHNTLVIDEASVAEIERSGYPKLHVMSSLNNDDLNHVTTFYYLLQTQKEY